MKDNGFTLLELTVVMVIVGILAGIILPVFLSSGIDYAASTLQGSVLSAKSFAVTKRKRCLLVLHADYYVAPHYLPCTFTIEDMAKTFQKEYQLPKYVRLWQYKRGNNAVEDFTNGTKTVYFEAYGISHDSRSITIPEDIVITLKDIKTGFTTTRTIIGSTCQIKK